MHGGSSSRFPTKPTEKLKIEKMYAIKQIKICAEYRDMLPRPRLDLSGTPGLRPIGLSPGSWQTSLGLGSMSRYSAQILICIINTKIIVLQVSSSLWLCYILYNYDNVSKVDRQRMWHFPDHVVIIGTPCIYPVGRCSKLTHGGRDKMAAILQTIFSNAFS